MERPGLVIWRFSFPAPMSAAEIHKMRRSFGSRNSRILKHQRLLCQRYKSTQRTPPRTPLHPTTSQASHGTTPTVSSTPSTPHPHFSASTRNTRFRVLTFFIGAGVGVALFSLSVHSEAETPVSKLPNTDVTPVSYAQKDQVANARAHPGVYLWGSNKEEIVAPGIASDTIADPNAVEYFRGKVVRDLALGAGHAAAIDADGNLVQWGNKYFGTSEKSSLSPHVTLEGRDLVEVACTENKIYALSRRGDIYCLSSNLAKQSQDSSAPLPSKSSWWPLSSASDPVVKLTPPSTLSRSEKIKSIATGRHHLLAVTNRGRVLSIPADKKGNRMGQLGTGNTDLPATVSSSDEESAAYATELNDVATLNGVVVEHVACGENHSLARTIDGRVFGFGANGKGQLAAELTPSQSIATPYELDTLWSASPFQRSAKPLDTQCSRIAAGGNTSLFVIDRPTNTDVLACGTGLNGQLGNGSYAHVTNGPVRVKVVSGLSEWNEKEKKVKPIRVRNIFVAPDGGHCAATLDNDVGGRQRKSWWPFSSQLKTVDAEMYGRDVLVWGGNQSGQLARGDARKANSPVPVYPKAISYDGTTLAARDEEIEEVKEAAVSVVDEETGALPLDLEAKENRAKQWDVVDVGRLEVAPAGVVVVKDSKGRERKVVAEQKVVLGDGVTGVYMTVVAK